LAQIDMVFVKVGGFFRKSHFYATPEQRERHTKKVSKDNPSK